MTEEPLGRRLKHVLITGFFIVGPFSLTFILLSWFIASIDRILAPLVGFLGLRIPGLGIIVALGLLLLAGILGSNIVVRHLLGIFEELLLKIPVFNWVYRTVKQLTEVFSPEGRSRFKGVVLVEYPRPSVYSIGFVTNEISVERESGASPLVAVYIPTNHVYIGDVVLVPRAQLIATALTQQEGVQAAISAGAALPHIIRAKNQQ